MVWLLDTNICIGFLKGEDPRIREGFARQSPDDFRLCSIVKAELLFGARKSAHVEKNLTRLNALFRAFESLPFDDLAAEHYGVIRNALQAEGKPIGGNDLLIASIALARNLVVLTRNQGEFLRVPGLRCEVW